MKMSVFPLFSLSTDSERRKHSPIVVPIYFCSRCHRVFPAPNSNPPPLIPRILFCLRRQNPSQFIFTNRIAVVSVIIAKYKEEHVCKYTHTHTPMWWNNNRKINGSNAERTRFHWSSTEEREPEWNNIFTAHNRIIVSSPISVIRWWVIERGKKFIHETQSMESARECRNKEKSNKTQSLRIADDGVSLYVCEL